LTRIWSILCSSARTQLGAQIQNVKSLIQESELAGTPDDREGARQLHELMAVYSAQKRHIHRLLDVRTL